MDPNRYAVSEPELLRTLRLSGQGGFLQDHPEIAGFSLTFWRSSAVPAGSSQVRQGDRGLDLERYASLTSRTSVPSTTEGV
jgi:hypothetical protein